MGAEIILAGTETPFAGLVCKVTEISGDWAFQIESELSWEAYPFEPSGLSGIWHFTSLADAQLTLPISCLPFLTRNYPHYSNNSYLGENEKIDFS